MTESGRMRIPIVFGLIGLLSGGFTLVVIFSADEVRLAPIFVFGSPGFIFGSGLALSLLIAQQGAKEKVAARRVIVALVPVALGYPALASLFLGISSVVSLIVGLFLDFQQTLSISFWIGLSGAGVAGAFLLWTSLRLLPVKAEVALLWQMFAGALLVCGITAAVDALLGYSGFPSRGTEREWANSSILFLMGNTVMAFLYGIGFRDAIVARGQRPHKTGFWGTW